MATNISEWEPVESESDWEPVAEPTQVDLSQIKPSPYETLTAAGTKPETGMESGTGFLEAMSEGGSPLAFAKNVATLPIEAAFTAATAPGKLAYLSAADIVSKVAGQPEYGGNIQATMERGGEPLPVERFIGGVADTNYKLAVTANVAKAIPELASLMAINPSGAAGRMLALGFSADMIAKSQPLFREYANEYYKPAEQQDKGKLAELESGILQTLVFAPLAGTHGLNRPVERLVFGKGRALGRELAEQLAQAPLEGKLNVIPPRIPIAGADIRGEPIPGLAERQALMDQALAEAQQRIEVPGRVPAIELLRRAETEQIQPAGWAGAPISLEGGGKAPFGKVSYMRAAEAPLPEKTQLALEREKQNASEIAKAEGVPQLEVRPRMGEEAPLRQPGEVAERVVRGPEGEVLPPVEPPKEVKSKPVPEGETLVTVQKPDGTTYQASTKGKFYTHPKRGKVQDIAILDQRGEWTHGMLPEGDKIIEGPKIGETPTEPVATIGTQPTEPAKPTTAEPGTVGFGMPPIVGEMIAATAKSAAELRGRISSVRLAPYVEGQKTERIIFELDGKEYSADLRGRNKDLVIGMGKEQDAGIAVRALLDGDAKPITSPSASVGGRGAGAPAPAFSEPAKPTTAGAAEGVPKQPWEMTYREFMGDVNPMSRLGRSRATIHEQLVKEAYQRGDPVPVHVLNEYPELLKGLPGLRTRPLAKPTNIEQPPPKIEGMGGAVKGEWGIVPGEEIDGRNTLFRMTKGGPQRIFWSRMSKQYVVTGPTGQRMGGAETIDSAKAIADSINKPIDKQATPMSIERAPFQVDEQLVMRSPHTGEDTIVSYRGKPSNGQAVVWSGKSQFQVPEDWLRRQGEKYVKPEQQTQSTEKLPIQTPMAAEGRGVVRSIPLPTTKSGLVDELVGPKPSDYPSQTQWKKRKSAIERFTKEELTTRVISTRKEKARFEKVLELVSEISPELQNAADSAGVKWRATLKERLKSEGINYSFPGDNTKGEAIYNVAKAIAEKRIRQQPEPPPKIEGMGAAVPSEPSKPGIISGTALEKWASDRLAESQKRLTVGIDPELMAAYAIKGAAILERGVRDFAKWSVEMVKEHGETIKPHLRRIYQQANNIFVTPGRYAIEEGKLKIVSEQEARRMERAVKLAKNVAGIKDQLDLFDKEIGDALTEGGRFLPKDLRPEVAKGVPAEKRTVTNKEINQYFVNKLVTVRAAMQKLRGELSKTADPASEQYFDVLQKRFELAFRQVQELRRASHESLYFWNQIKAEYQDIARMAGQMPEIRRRLPILDQLVKDLRGKDFARAGKDFVDYLRINLFTPFSFTLDFTSNVLAVGAHVPAWLAMDVAHLVAGKPVTRTMSALRALRLSGKNMIPGTERFRLPEEIEAGLGTTAGGEFQGLPKEVMVDFSEILKNNPRLASKLKNVDYILGGPVRMKRAVDNFFGRFGATAELYSLAYQSGRAKKLKGDSLKQYVEQFVLNPPEEAVANAIRVGGEFKFNRELPRWAERFANNIITKLAVEAYPRWTLQFTKWAGEMLGVDPAFAREAAKGNISAERIAAYLAKATTGWGAIYAFNQLFYNQVDPNTMEYVNEKGDRVRLSGRQPFPELYMITALLRGDIDNAKAAFPYTSIPFASMTGGQGGLLSPIMQTMIESWKGNYTAEQTARELTKVVNNALPGKSLLGLMRAIYDPTIREGVGAPIPGVAQALPTRINITTGEPLAPQQRIPGTPIKLPTVGGTPFPGAVRVLNPIEKVLLNHGISRIRPKRTSLIELPAEEIPEKLRREYEQRVGLNVKEIIGEAIKSPDWAELSGKENFELRRDLLLSWMNLARSMAKAELAEKYNKGMAAEKLPPLTVRRLPEFVKELPAGK